jgi:hypothetical protein
MSEKCGGLHSVKWYKENSRVFVYSPISNFKNAEVQSLPTLKYIMHISTICPLGYNDFYFFDKMESPRPLMVANKILRHIHKI